MAPVGEPEHAAVQLERDIHVNTSIALIGAFMQLLNA
jgi:hypothetical protein